MKLPDGTVKVLVEGGERARVTRIMSDKPYMEAEIALLADKVSPTDEIEALERAVMAQFEQYVKQPTQHQMEMKQKR